MTELLTNTELDEIETRHALTMDTNLAVYDVSRLLTHIHAQSEELAALRAKLNRYAPPELTEEAANVASVRYVYSNFGKLRPEEPEKCECCENGRKCRCDVRDEDF